VGEERLSKSWSICEGIESSISFQMPSRDVLELDCVLHVLELTKSLLLVSYMIDSKLFTAVDGQQVTIRDNNHAHGQVLPRGVQGVGLYKLLAHLVEQVLQGTMMEEHASNLEEASIEPIVASLINSLIPTIWEYGRATR